MSTKRKYKSILSEANQISGRTRGLQTIFTNSVLERAGIKKKKSGM